MQVKDWSEAIGKPVKMRDGAIAFIAGDASKIEGFGCILSPLVGFFFSGSQMIGCSWDKNGEDSPGRESPFDLIEYPNKEELERFEQEIFMYSLNFYTWHNIPVVWEGSPFEIQKLTLKTERGTYIIQSEDGIAEIKPETIKDLKPLWKLESPGRFSVKSAISGRALETKGKRLALIVEDISKFPMFHGFPKPLIGGTFNPNGDLCCDSWMPNGKYTIDGFENCEIKGYADPEELEAIIEAMADTVLKVAYNMEAFLTWDGIDGSHKIIGHNARGRYIYEKDGKIAFLSRNEAKNPRIVKWR
jgi:hypothetical protein